MTQVNLLPGDLRERQKVQRLTALVVVGVAAVVALAVFVFVLQLGKLSSAKDRLREQEGVNAQLQAQIGELQEFADLRAQVEAREVLSDTALSGEVLWSGVLRDVSMVIPGEMWLTSLTGSLAESGGVPAATGTAPLGGTDTIVGTIQFQGFAADHPTVARWLTRLVKVTGWENSWVSNQTEADYGGETKVQWTGSIDLTTLATVQGRPVQ